MNTLKCSLAAQIAKEQKNAQLNTNNGVKIKNNWSMTQIKNAHIAFQ